MEDTRDIGWTENTRISEYVFKYFKDQKFNVILVARLLLSDIELTQTHQRLIGYLLTLTKDAWVVLPPTAITEWHFPYLKPVAEGHQQTPAQRYKALQLLNLAGNLMRCENGVLERDLALHKALLQILKLREKK